MSMSYLTHNLHEFRSTVLRAAGSDRPGMHVELYAELGPRWRKSAKDPLWLQELWPGDPEELRRVPGLPRVPMLVLPAKEVPEELRPAPVPHELALALLALSSQVNYHPDRPVVLTQARLCRGIVLCRPHRFHEFH